MLILVLVLVLVLKGLVLVLVIVSPVLVNVTANLYPISHRVRVIAAYWSNYRFRQRCLYFPPSFGVNP